MTPDQPPVPKPLRVYTDPEEIAAARALDAALRPILERAGIIPPLAAPRAGASVVADESTPRPHGAREKSPHEAAQPCAETRQRPE